MNLIIVMRFMSDPLMFQLLLYNVHVVGLGLNSHIDNIG